MSSLFFPNIIFVGLYQIPFNMSSPNGPDLRHKSRGVHIVVLWMTSNRLYSRSQPRKPVSPLFLAQRLGMAKNMIEISLQMVDFRYL
jgi:hypothetical protein